MKIGSFGLCSCIDTLVRRKNYIKLLIKHEVNSQRKYSIIHRIQAWRRGFLSDSYAIYPTVKQDPSSYLNDWDRYLKTPFIDRGYDQVLDNKLVFRQMLSAAFPEVMPAYIALIRKTYISSTDRTADLLTAEALIGLIKHYKRVVIKPVDGSGGKAIYVVTYDQDFCINHRQATIDDITRLIQSRRHDLVSAYIQQAPYAAAIYGKTTNTVRILTLWDKRTKEPFIAAAVHRFGSAQTGMVDNFLQGGLSAAVDLKTGTLTKAARMGIVTLEWSETHPDTGEQIEGVTIPGWEMISTSLLKMARFLHYIPYIGWDVVVTDSGFKVLEANRYSSVDLFQIHSPLLRQARVRQFYQDYGVLNSAR